MVLAAIRDPVAVILVVAGVFDGISGNPVHSTLLFAVAAALGYDAVRRKVRTMASGEIDASSGPGSLHVAGDGGARPSSVTKGGPGVEPASGLLRNPLLVAAVLLVGVVYAGVVGTFGRYSWPATVGVLVPGAAALALAWRGPIEAGVEPPAIDRLGILAWLCVLVGLALWELTELLLQPSLHRGSYAHPTISVLTDPILATHPGRSVVLFLWLAFGWWLVRL
jgi:hypothetical protein